MPEIKLEHITKRWGKFYAVEDLNLVIADNAFVTLLGPSGCGKSTTLRMIAGSGKRRRAAALPLATPSSLTATSASTSRLTSAGSASCSRIMHSGPI